MRHDNIADLFEVLGLHYILPEHHGSEEVEKSILNRTLVVMHIYYSDQMEMLRGYVAAIPDGIHVLFTTSKDDTAACLEKEFGERTNIAIRKTENRGRDLSALLVVARQEFEAYDYICFVHDKKTPSIPKCSSLDFQEILWDNLLHGKEYILNVLQCFEEHPHLGLLVPPAPMHGLYLSSLGNRWGSDFQRTTEVAASLHIQVPMDEAKTCVAVGSAFWCKKEALQILWNYPWTYEDFPEEPLPMDGTISHALERLFPFAAQQAGYLTGWVMTERQAAVEARNSRYLLEEILKNICQKRNPLAGLPFAGIAAEVQHSYSDNAYDHFFPYHLFHSGDRVMLYGAGNIGKQFYRQAVHDGYVKIVGIVDKNAATIDREDIPVESIETLQKKTYDYVLITMNNPLMANDGKNDIKTMGVPEEKIKWDGTVYYRDHFYQQYYYQLMDDVNPDRECASDIIRRKVSVE